MQHVVFEYEDYRGPVPHGDLFEGWQRAIPNGGERVMTLVEAESLHRRGMERRSLSLNFVAHMTGQVLAWGLAGGIVVAGYLLIDHGKSLVGYVTLLTGAGGLVASIIRELRRTGRTDGE